MMRQNRTLPFSPLIDGLQAGVPRARGGEGPHSWPGIFPTPSGHSAPPPCRPPSTLAALESVGTRQLGLSSQARFLPAPRGPAEGGRSSRDSSQHGRLPKGQTLARLRRLPDQRVSRPLVSPHGIEDPQSPYTK